MRRSNQEDGPVLRRGASGVEVAVLQDLLNRNGALLTCDGNFGTSTETAVKEAQEFAGLPVTGISDVATCTWLKQQPEPSNVIPTEAVTFIVRQKVGSRKFYDQNMATPNSPGPTSTLEIGICYDLHFQVPEQFEADWADVLPRKTVDVIRPFVGKRVGHEALHDLMQVRIPFPAAWKVFVICTLPPAVDQTSSEIGDLLTLPPLCRGALVSLVYSCGPQREGNYWHQLKTIRDHIAAGRLDQVAAALENIKPLWPGTDAIANQRQDEAKMWRRGLASVIQDGR